MAAERSEGERSGAKPRGHGRGRRNINQWRFLTEQFVIKKYCNLFIHDLVAEYGKSKTKSARRLEC